MMTKKIYDENGELVEYFGDYIESRIYFPCEVCRMLFEHLDDYFDKVEKE